MTAKTTTDASGWPRQLRLPGQAAAPDGPVDLSMMFVMHHAFRRDLAAFATAVPRTPVTDRDTWRALAARWVVLVTALHHHHEGEDRWLWPALLERADPGERRTLAEMVAEHEAIDPLLESAALGLEALAAGAGEDVRAALAVRLAAARESLGRHLAHEETDAVRILQASLSVAQWAGIEAHFGEGVTLGRVLTLVPWAVHGVPAHLLRDLFARTGRTHRVIWWFTRRRFARRESRAFRYV